MFNTKVRTLSGNKFDHLVFCSKNYKPAILYANPDYISSVMWRNVAKAISFSLKRPLSRAYSFLGFSQESIFREKFRFGSLEMISGGIHELGSRRIDDIFSHEDCTVRASFGVLRNENWCNGLCPRGYASVAEAVSSTDVEQDVSVNEIQELFQEMKREGQNDGENNQGKRRRLPRGMRYRKYPMLRRRQVKIETEAWEQAANEYKELLEHMCEQKLAPNLPYMKSLFLGWFEPMRDAIIQEQERCQMGKHKVACAPHFDQLPADMMAVITMHKLMGLLMTGGEHGQARVVQAACIIGDAVEQEVRIHKFLEKTKMRKNNKIKEDGGGESDTITAEQAKLRKKVTNLIEKHKLLAVRQIVKGQNDFKPWSQDAKAKVGSRLIELLMQTAYVQSAADQLADGPPDVRPAFIHTFRTVAKENKNHSRKYGVIECDLLVLKGLERTARHMVIPYMPMLVPPVKWTGYDKGAHLFLPSYVMRTHGAKQQRDAVKRAPRKQLEPVFEALDTLGSTKWRVNKRILSVVDRIWSSGGRLADLVDRNDVPLPEKPDTEDEAQLKKWKWKVRYAKKENRERHSQRCDIELKLSVARKMKVEEGFYYPHNVDFRGRAYPMHPYLNHLGSDLCRGILEFAEGRPLRKSGLHWLKIHLANLYAGGVDKLSHGGRLAFAENHLDDIFDSADRPLEGRRWWLKAEDPFQCLAMCINLTEALRSSSPETFISHIPVHQVTHLITSADPGVMVAWTGIEHFCVGRFDPSPTANDPEDFVYDLRPRWPFGEEYAEGRSDARSLRKARIHPSLTSIIQASMQQQS